MNFNEYQKEAWGTAVHPNAGKNHLYATLGLVGEAGEVANKVKKIERDAGGVLTNETRAALKAELGDVLWYLACLSTELGIDLDSVASENLEKIYSRKERDQLKGSGDVR